MNDITKYFKDGSYVKVVSGLYKDTVGSIVEINNNNIATILS